MHNHKNQPATFKQIDMAKKTDTDTKLAVIANDVGYIKAEVQNIQRQLEVQYVTRAEFEPVKKVVYGLVALVLTAVIGALVGLVVIK